MTTRLQKLAAAVQELGSTARAQLSAPQDQAGLARLEDTGLEVYALEPEIRRLAGKAAETHSDKRVYGPGMAAKVHPSAQHLFNFQK